MTMREMYEELKMVHCEDYEVCFNGNFSYADIADIEYEIDDDSKTVFMGKDWDYD